MVVENDFIRSYRSCAQHILHICFCCFFTGKTFIFVPISFTFTIYFSSFYLEHSNSDAGQEKELQFVPFFVPISFIPLLFIIFFLLSRTQELRRGAGIGIHIDENGSDRSGI